MKKFFAVALAALLALGACVGALAADVDVGAVRVTLGADLTEAEKDQIYRDFGVERGTVEELTITNSDERRYLAGLVNEGKIGNVALSCIYIETQEAGSGLTIITQNINYCTEDMYKNALTTAGISDALVRVSAPKPVSGTAALTGAYIAYEDIAGVQLSELAKQVGVEELLLTGELAEFIGSDEATALINELKGILDQTQGMSDAEVMAEIKSLASAYGVSLTDTQFSQVLSLVRKMEGLDTEQIRSQLETMTKAAQGLQSVGNFFSKLGNGVKTFFSNVGSFFKRLFGG